MKKEVWVLANPVEEASDVAAFDLLGVDEIDAVLGTVEGDVLRRTATGATLRVRTSEAVLAEVAGGCVWVAGPVTEGAISLQSWGNVPASVCALAARGGV